MYLISFVNQLLSPSFRILLVDKEFKSVEFIDHLWSIDSQGATGICVLKSCIFIAFQNGNIGKVNQDLTLNSIFKSNLIKDPHSIISRRNKLYVSSTGTNSVIQLTLDDRNDIIAESIYWKYPNLSDYDYDYVHLNSLAFFKNNLFVTTFGKRAKGESWTTAVNGNIINTNGSKIVLDGLTNPHSLIKYKKTLAVCNSISSEIVSLDNEIIVNEKKGYLRGLVYNQRKKELIYAVNARRNLKKSSLNEIRGRIGEHETKNKSSYLKIFTNDGKSNVVLDLRQYGKEVYDIQIIPDTFSIATVLPDSNRQRIGQIEESFIKVVNEFNDSVDRLKLKFHSDTTALVGFKEKAKNELLEKNNEIQIINREIEFLQLLNAERKTNLESLSRLSHNTIQKQTIAIQDNLNHTRSIEKLIKNTNSYLEYYNKNFFNKVDADTLYKQAEIIRKTYAKISEYIDDNKSDKFENLRLQSNSIRSEVSKSNQSILDTKRRIQDQTESILDLQKIVNLNKDKINNAEQILSLINHSISESSNKTKLIKTDLESLLLEQNKTVLSKLTILENISDHSILNQALLSANKHNLSLRNESKKLNLEIEDLKSKIAAHLQLIGIQELDNIELSKYNLTLEQKIEFNQAQHNEMHTSMDTKIQKLKNKLELITISSDAQIRHLEKLLRSRDHLNSELLKAKKDQSKQKADIKELISEVEKLKNEIKHRDVSITVLNEQVNKQIDHHTALKKSASFKIGYILTRIPAFLMLPFVKLRNKSDSVFEVHTEQTSFKSIEKKDEKSQSSLKTTEKSSNLSDHPTDKLNSSKQPNRYKISKISVITPSYNQAEYLPDCIKTVKDQSISAIEHLIFDPGSDDGSIEIAKNAKDVTLINEKDDGQADAIATGMLRAKGEIIAWLNSDDYYENNNVFQTIVERFNEDDQPDMIYCNGYYLNEKNEKIKDAYINKNPKTLQWKLQEEVGILQPAMFFKKSLIDKIGPVNRLLHFCMDYEFWIRAVKSGAKIVYLDSCTTIARYYQDNKTMGQRGKSLKEICDMVLDQYGYVNHKWLKRYAEFLIEGLDGVLNNRSNSQINDEAAVHKSYKNLLRQYNLSATSIQTLETNKDKKGYQSTYKEMSKLGLFDEKVKCQEIALDKKTIPNHVCYTVAKKRWAFDRKWKEAQVKRTMEYVNIAERKRNSKCIIVGNGPSLRKIDFSLLKDSDIFICNNTFLDKQLLSCATYYTVVNNLVAEQGYQNINAIKGITKIFPYWLAYCLQPDQDTYFVNSVGHPEFSTDMKKNVSWRHTVSFFNMQLAYGLGYEEVALIGMDHSYRQDQQYKEGEEILELTDDDNHFNPNYFKGKKWHAADVDNMEAMYVLAKEAFEKDNRKIYNCTVGGHLELFDRMTLREFLYRDNISDSAIAAFKNEFASSKMITRINAKYDHLDEGDLVLDYLEGSSKDKNMINVGAHHGWGLKKFVEKNWNVYAFEPDNKNRKILKQHLGKHKNLIIDPRAVSNKEVNNQSFFTSKVSTGISSLGTFHKSHKETQAVDVTTITKWQESNKIDSCDFLLVDVEGYDLFVLEGFPWETLKPKVVIAEFEDSKTLPLGYSYKDLGNFLLSKGYNVVLSEWHPIVEYGKKHKWSKLQSFPCNIGDKAWGNFIAVKKGIDINQVFNDNF